MAAVGGDIIEVTYDHPTLGSSRFYAKSEEDGTIDRGGFRTSDDANGITGSGETIRKITRVRWSLEVMIRWDMSLGLDVQKLSDLAADPVEANWTFSHVSGVTWGGRGAPVGDIQGSTGEATTTMKISGGGVLSKITG